MPSGSSALDSGLVNIFVTGSTAAITTIEYEEGVLADFLRALTVFAPDDCRLCRHNTRWGDGNGRSHVRASFSALRSRYRSETAP